jgi:hypothetical protein
VQHLPGKKPFAPLAQLAEQVTLNHWVAGSIPARCNVVAALRLKRGAGQLAVEYELPAGIAREFSVRQASAAKNQLVSSD